MTPDSTARAASRDPALDLLRSLALGRVLLWHAFAATWLTAIAAMPVMFFVAGTLLGEREGRGGGHARFVLRRGRRLLVPLWVYGAVVATAMAVATGTRWTDAMSIKGFAAAATWVLPLVDPVDATWEGGWLSNHLWYLRAYLWVLLLAPVLRSYARALLPALFVFAIAIVQLEIFNWFEVPYVGTGVGRVLIGDFVTYGLFAVLGLAHASRSRPWPRPALWLIAIGGAAGAIGFARAFGLPSGGINASYPAVALTGLAWLGVAGLCERPIRAVASVPAVSTATSAICSRAVSIYLWHPAAIVGALAVADAVPVHGWHRVPFVLALAVAGTAAAVALMGWVEDVAAGRRRVPLPAIRLASALPAGTAALVIAVPLLVVDTDTASASNRGAVPPPSYRDALSSSEFAGRAPRPDAPIRLRWGRFPEQRMQRVLDAWMAAHPEYQSAAVAVTVNGKTWTSDTHRDPRAPAFRKDAPFVVASITKLFTIAMVMREVDAGRIALDEPVPRLPGVVVPRRSAPITPRQLLRHTSGLVTYTDARGFDPEAVLTPQEAVSMALRSNRLSRPDEGVHYSNTNYLYLGLLLEHVTGASYEELLRHLTTSVGLHRTKLAPPRPGWVGFSSGGVESTAAEVTTFLDALFTPGRIVSPARIADMTSVDEFNIALGAWPFCPCGTTDAGVKTYEALGQVIGHGAAAWFPGQMSIVMRIEPAPMPLDMSPLLMSIADPLRDALRR